jgi:hypothetical protein
MLDISEKSDFINFICKILNNGISSESYSYRADLLLNNLNVEKRQMEYCTTLVVCEFTVGHVIGALMKNYPSAIEIADCSVCNHIIKRKIMPFQINVNDNL